MDPIHMQFSHSFSWWVAAIGLAAAAIIIAFAYRRTDRELSRRLRVTLVALRVVAIGLLLFCLLEPTIVAREEVRRKANLLVLADDSRSMSLVDTGEGVSRIDAAKEALIGISNLADSFNIRLYQFSSECKHVEKLNLTAGGTLTDIGGAISKAADEWRGQLTAGIVLVTDGGNNIGDRPVEIARQLGMPVYTVGVGSTQMPRDIQVAKVEVSPIAYADHILPVKAIIRSSGYDGREVKVSLMRDNELKDSAPLTLDSRNGEQMVELQIKPQQPGAFSFSITVPVAPDELTDQNNVYPFFVKVVKSKLKVLYIDGRPRWEYTFLRRALQRDPNIDPTCLVVTGNQVSPPRFPATRKEIFLYDVVVLGDISPGFFGNEKLNMIKNFVEDRGGPLIFLGGKGSLGTGGFGESVLREMLPVEIKSGGARRVGGAFSPILTEDGLRHPITRLSNDRTENAAIWRDLPALTQFYIGAGVKLGATVLAEHQRERGQPVIAFQRYGKGMVLMFASDSLWRWAFGAYPFGGGDSHYNKFWSGTVRWLASIRTEAELVTVETDKASYHRDEKVRITAYVYDESYMPVSDAQFSSRIILPLEKEQPPYSDGEILQGTDLTFSPDGNGRYSAEFAPDRDGHFRVDVEANYAGKLLGKNSAEFIVQITALEFQDTQLKEDLLKELADVSGGSYRHLRDISDLPSSIVGAGFKPAPYVLTRERGLWDNGIMLFIAVALLGTEWLLRKRKGLV